MQRQPLGRVCSRQAISSALTLLFVASSVTSSSAVESGIVGVGEGLSVAPSVFGADDDCSRLGGCDGDEANVELLQSNAQKQTRTSRRHAHEDRQAPVVKEGTANVAKESAEGRATGGGSATAPADADAQPVRLPPRHVPEPYEAEVQMLVTAVGCIVVGLLVVLFCSTCDACFRWLHDSRFSACKRMIERLEKSLKARGKLGVCPCCAGLIGSSIWNRSVSFMCGHCFHLSCVNGWYKDNVGAPIECPICADTTQVCNECTKDTIQVVDGDTAEVAEVAAENAEETYEVVGDTTRPQDADESVPAVEEKHVLECAATSETVNFFLRNLRGKWPDIVPPEMVERWSRYSVDLWLTELKCPEYTPPFQRKKAELTKRLCPQRGSPNLA